MRICCAIRWLCAVCSAPYGVVIAATHDLQCHAMDNLSVRVAWSAQGSLFCSELTWAFASLQSRLSTNHQLLKSLPYDYPTNLLPHLVADLLYHLIRFAPPVPALALCAFSVTRRPFQSRLMCLFFTPQGVQLFVSNSLGSCSVPKEFEIHAPLRASLYKRGPASFFCEKWTLVHLEPDPASFLYLVLLFPSVYAYY